MTDLQLSGNAQDRSSLLIEVMDLLVEGETPPACSLGASSFATGPLLAQGVLHAGLQTSGVWDLGVTEEAFDGFPQIFEHMPPVYHLFGGWSAVPGSTLIVFGSIAANDFHTRMLPEPLCKGFGAAIWQQVDRPVRL
jgi:hypothetical protein